MYYDIYILSRLMNGPCHGYDIKKGLIEGVSTCTNISNNSLYPILKKYEKMGAITKSIEFQGTKPNRVNYSITNEGKKIFIQTLRSFPESLVAKRDEFMMRVVFFHLIDIPTRKKILDLRQEFIEDAMLKTKKESKVSKDIFTPRTSESQDFNYRVLELELALIDGLRQRIEEPCLVSDDGEIF